VFNFLRLIKTATRMNDLIFRTNRIPRDRRVRKVSKASRVSLDYKAPREPMALLALLVKPAIQPTTLTAMAG
jgi:hypothetical protein